MNILTALDHYSTGGKYMRQFDKRKGTFKPQRADDLKPGVTECVGMYCIWEALWVVEDGLTGNLFAGC